MHPQQNNGYQQNLSETSRRTVWLASSVEIVVDRVEMEFSSSNRKIDWVVVKLSAMVRNRVIESTGSIPPLIEFENCHGLLPCLYTFMYITYITVCTGFYTLMHVTLCTGRRTVCMAMFMEDKG